MSRFKNVKTPMLISLPTFVQVPVPDSPETDEKAQKLELPEDDVSDTEEKEGDQKVASELKKVKLVIVSDDDGKEKVEEEQEIFVTPEQEEMFARLEQLPKPRAPVPDPGGFSIEHEDYPFIIEGQKVRSESVEF